jgi:hypothetical protein
MFKLLDVSSILICLDQFYSLSNLILILKFHKIILATLLGVLSIGPKHSSSHSSNWNFYCSGLGAAFVYMPVVTVFSICMLLTSPAYDAVVCLCVWTMTYSNIQREKTITNNGGMNKSNTQAAIIEIPIRGIRTRVFRMSGQRP